jgi:hypothetical protein
MDRLFLAGRGHGGGVPAWYRRRQRCIRVRVNFAGDAVDRQIVEASGHPLISTPRAQQ